MKTPFLAILALVILMVCPLSAGADEIRILSWQILKTQHTIIKYQSARDLARFHTAVEFGPLDLNRSLELEDLTHQQIADMVIQKVDAIFTRAQEILDMRKLFDDPVSIFVYPDKKALKKAYESIYSGECRIRAWYRFKTNAIYLNVKDLHQGMLAHELAHYIIDHYLTVKPPPQTAEILARYVDTHLDRGFIINN